MQKVQRLIPDQEAPKPPAIRLVSCRIIIRCLSILVLFTKHPLFDHSSYMARSFLTTYFFYKLNPSNCFKLSRKSLSGLLYFSLFSFFPPSPLSGLLFIWSMFFLKITSSNEQNIPAEVLVVLHMKTTSLQRLCLH